MAQNYTRQSIFADGDTITAALFNDEYNQLVNTFNYSSTDSAATGHRHDGTAGEGGNIYRIGDLDFLNKIEADSANNRWGVFVEVGGSAVEQVRIQDGAVVPVTNNDVDLGSASLQFKDLYIDGTANIDSLVADTADINGGTIDGVTIGGSSAGAITGTTGQFNTSLNVDGTVTADGLTVEGTNGNFEVATTGNSVNMTRAGNNFITASDAVGDLFLGAGGVSFLKIDNGGDISFYEDTGATAKFFWDASTERLGLGTTSPATALDVVGATATDTLQVNGADPLNSAVAYIQSASDYTGWTSSNQSFGDLVQNTSLKSYPSTAGGDWILVAGRSINTEVGTNDTIDANFNFVYNDYSGMTKTAGSTSDIERLYFTNRYTVMNWEDPNTCKQYVGHVDNFNYQGIDANGRTSGSFRAGTVALAPPSGGTQTIGNTTGNLRISPPADATVNITNWFGNIPSMSISNLGGILNANITTATFFGTGPFWDLNAAYSGSSVTIGNLYGLRLTAPTSQANTTVTNNWGISQEWSDATNYFAGNVGVGTASPASKLHINSGVTDQGILVESTDTRALIGFKDNATLNTPELGGVANDLVVRTGNPGLVRDERLRVTSGGNVGIGTASPARTLHVNDVMRLEPRATAPSSPSAGDIFFNSSTNKLQCYDGTAWQDCF